MLERCACERRMVWVMQHHFLVGASDECPGEATLRRLDSICRMRRSWSKALLGRLLAVGGP